MVRRASSALLRLEIWGDRVEPLRGGRIGTVRSSAGSACSSRCMDPHRPRAARVVFNVRSPRIRQIIFRTLDAQGRPHARCPQEARREFLGSAGRVRCVPSRLHTLTSQGRFARNENHTTIFPTLNAQGCQRVCRTKTHARPRRMHDQDRPARMHDQRACRTRTDQRACTTSMHPRPARIYDQHASTTSTHLRPARMHDQHACTTSTHARPARMHDQHDGKCSSGSPRIDAKLRASKSPSNRFGLASSRPTPPPRVPQGTVHFIERFAVPRRLIPCVFPALFTGSCDDAVTGTALGLRAGALGTALAGAGGASAVAGSGDERGS